MTVHEKVPVVMPADHISVPVRGSWTYAEYATIPDDGQRYEVVRGVLYKVPTPSLEHQSASGRIYHYLFQHIELAGLGRVFVAPCDVELAPDVVVQPDVFVVLNNKLSILQGTRVVGVPTLVVEVASPGTASYDRREKRDAYQHAGVQEYWIADPGSRTIELLALDDGIYRTVGVFQGQAMLPSGVVSRLPVRVQQFFA